MFSKDKKGSAAESSGTISTLLGRDTVIEGTLTFQDTIRVDGRIKGNIQSTKGTLIIGENAVLDADIAVGVAIVRGKVNGRLDAGQRIEIHAPAQVNGDIRAPSVVIDSGVVFNGKCAMEQPDTAPEKRIEGQSKSVSEPPVDQKVTKKL